MKENKLIKCINYEMLLKYVRGFYQLEDSCDNLSYHVQSISEGRYSYIDFDELQFLTFSGYDNTNPIYVMIQMHKKGLLWIKGQIFPTVKKIIKFPIPIQKTFICELPTVNLTDSIEFRSHVSIFQVHQGKRTFIHTFYLFMVKLQDIHDPTDISTNHPNPYEVNAAAIYNNTMTLFPTIPKSSVIRGTVNATGNFTGTATGV